MSGRRFWITTALVGLCYWLCLRFVFPGFFAPFAAEHSDLFVGPALAASGRSFVADLGYPRPLGFLLLHVSGLLGYQGSLSVFIALALLNVALTIRLVSRWTGRPVAWPLAALYCLLLFTHPQFYFEYLHDAVGTAAYFLLIGAMNLWIDWRREPGHRGRLVLCAACLFLMAFTKETYYVTAGLFWTVELLRWRQRTAFAFVLGIALLFAAALYHSTHLAVTFTKIAASTDDPYYMSLQPLSVWRGAVFYARELFAPALAGVVLLALLLVGGQRVHLLSAVTSLLAGLVAFLPHAVLPNHLIAMYAYVAAPLALAPLLFVQLRRNWTGGLIVAGFLGLATLLIPPYRKAYAAADWTLQQARSNQAILSSFTALRRLTGTRMLVTGLQGPYEPFLIHEFIAYEFGQGKQWTVVVPQGASRDSRPPVQLVYAAEVRVNQFDTAVSYGEQGRLQRIWTGSELQTVAQPDAVIIPALGPLFAKLAKEPRHWQTLLSIGIAYTEWGWPARAEEYLQRAIVAAEGKNPYPYYFLGQVAEQRKDWSSARQYYQQAISHDEKTPNPAFTAGLARMQTLLSK